MQAPRKPFEPIRKRWRWLLLATLGFVPTVGIWVLDQVAGDIVVQRIWQFLYYSGGPWHIFHTAFSAINGHPIIAFVVAATCIVLAIELPAGITALKIWWKPPFVRPEDRPFPDILIQNLERPHLFHIERGELRWYIVFPRFRIVSNIDHVVTLDIQWQPTTYIPYVHGWNRYIKHPVNEPIARWEQLKGMGKVTAEPHLAFPFDLRPRESRSGYVAFTSSGHTFEQWFDRDPIPPYGDNESVATTLQVIEMRTGAIHGIVVRGGVRVIFRDDGTITVGE